MNDEELIKCLTERHGDTDWIYLRYPASLAKPNLRYSQITKTIQARYEENWYDMVVDPTFRQEIEGLIRARR